MTLGCSKKTRLRRAVLILGLAAVIDVCLSAPFGAELWDGVAAVPPGESYVADVLKDSRTGLKPLAQLKLAQVILVECAENRIDPVFVLALIKTESGFFNWSRSLKGALGLMQILPSTGRELAAELNLGWHGDATLLDPYLNVKIGIRYLSELKDRYEDTGLALTAYNAGPGTTDSRLRLGEEAEQKGFVNRVLDNYRDIKGRADYY